MLETVQDGEYWWLPYVPEGTNEDKVKVKSLNSSVFVTMFRPIRNETTRKYTRRKKHSDYEISAQNIVNNILNAGRESLREFTTAKQLIFNNISTIKI